MAVPFEIGIGDLVAELLAHTLVFGRALQAARAVSSRHLQPLLDLRHDLLVRIFLDLHFSFSPLDFFAIFGYTDSNPLKGAYHHGS